MNSEIQRRLTERGITLTEPKPPRYRYVSFIHAGDVAYFSGKTPLRDGTVVLPGRLGAEVSTEEGQEAARICAINLLSAVEYGIGLEHVRSVLKLTGYVSSAPDFFDQPVVVDAASELLADVLCGRGEHARTAIGVAALPGNAAVELDLIVRLDASLD